MAKESLQPVQCGLKGMNSQEEGLALLRWAIAGQKALWKAQGKQREFFCQGPHMSKCTALIPVQ